MAKLNLSGQKFGLLTAIHQIESSYRRKSWLFKCDCGSDFIYLGTRIKNGHKRSCGCEWKSHVAASARKRDTTHGHAKTPIYVIWRGIISRCENKNYLN